VNNTAYLPLSTIGLTGSTYEGGICKWWYTPIENLDGFPMVDPTSQQLKHSPTLKINTNWYGPVNIPTYEVGYEEPDAISASGIYYKQKLVGLIPGANSTANINLRNLSQKQLCVVAKLRSGGFYIIMGTNEFGMILSTQFSTTIGVKDTPSTKFFLTLDSLNKAMVLPAFFDDNSIVPQIGDTSTTNAVGGVPSLEADFNVNGDTTIIWTNALAANYGNFPTLEVWSWDSDYNRFYKANLPIDSVGNPPTQFTIRNNGGIGKIIIS
jgi:hypothetical protein